MNKKATAKRVRKLLEDIESKAQASPLVWIGAARQFKRLEELNRPKIEEERAKREPTSPSYVRVEERPIPLEGFDVFLMGAAIENLLKGVLSAKGWSFQQIIQGRHDLAKLYRKCCRLCALRINDDEHVALKKLEHFVYWVGKYNLPKADLATIMSLWGLNAVNSLCGPIMTLPVSELERKSILAVYERFLNYFKMGYTQIDLRKCPGETPWLRTC